jgi:hypothetical protein
MPWLLALWANPLVRKIIIYAALGLGCLYAGRLWLNSHDSKVYQQGKMAAAVELEKAKQTEWAAKEKAMADQMKVLDAAAQQLENDRANLTRSLNETLAAIQKAKMQGAGAVATIPASELNSALRAISRQLAAE